MTQSSSDSDEITASFRRFGPLVVDWPHKAESKSYFPPKGYAFLLFQVRRFLPLFFPFIFGLFGLIELTETNDNRMRLLDISG